MHSLHLQPTAALNAPPPPADKHNMRAFHVAIELPTAAAIAVENGKSGLE